MSPDKTPADRLRDALMACHDAAYTEAFKAALDALDRLAVHMVGDRKPSKRQAVAIRGSFIVLAEAARQAAKLQFRHGQYEAALLSYGCGERLAEMAKERCAEVLARLGGAE